ncbi:Alpha-muurolene synthase [Marasmius crinis-equi]|uniref:Terpene synthase n=1 Tax=Marasmius crinis-equi TaxID=585013 RepID=A0ABR3FEN1_9AGAR
MRTNAACFLLQYPEQGNVFVPLVRLQTVNKRFRHESLTPVPQPQNPQPADNNEHKRKRMSHIRPCPRPPLHRPPLVFSEAVYAIFIIDGKRRRKQCSRSLKGHPSTYSPRVVPVHRPMAIDSSIDIPPLAPTAAEVAANAIPDAPHFILPDLVSHCNYPLSYHEKGDEIASQSVKWLDQNCPILNEKRRKALYGLQAGELTAFCYNTAEPHRLRVISDFMNYLFHLDNISDGMMTNDTDLLADTVMNALWAPQRYRPTMFRGKEQPVEEHNAGKLARDFWMRAIADAKPGPQARFKETFELFFNTVNQQARARDAGKIPTLEEYINIRRDTSGCKPCWALIEYGLDIDLPPIVANNPTIRALGQHTNDLVTWSNDIFSYNIEQARGDTHNMIVILMNSKNKTLEQAMERVGEMCEEAIKNFEMKRKVIPTKWVDEEGNVYSVNNDEVQRYVKGLQDWIVGSLHWSFQTTRYFGTGGQDVKKNRKVYLRPVSEEAKW